MTERGGLCPEKKRTNLLPPSPWAEDERQACLVKNKVPPAGGGEGANK